MPPLSQAVASGSSIAIASTTPPQRGDKLTFAWATDAPDAKNWIGVYDGDRQPRSGSSSLVWAYVPDAASGQTTIDTSGLSGGPYTAYLLAKDGYGILARTEAFSFAGAPTGSSITLTTPAPHEGDKVSFHWATDAPDAKNWIGVYDGDRQPGHGASLAWEYTPGASGDITIDTSGLSGGPYTAYLLAKDGYGILAHTAAFTFTVRPVFPRPHAVVDAVTTTPQTAGTAFSVKLGGLWIRPEGNAAGSAAFKRVTGDGWLSVAADGTVEGKAPAIAPRTPGRLVVAVTDSAVGTDTVTVQVPVRASRDRLRLKVATLNLWDAGTHIDGFLEKQLRLVLTQGLDVVALQECGDDGAGNLAGALGWHVHQAGGLGIVSRYPLTDVVAPTAALPAAAATLHLPGDRTVRLWTAQLDEADYGPYALLAGRTPAQVETAEKGTARYRQTQALVTAMRSDLASRTPVVLAGGLASPSHHDWTNRTASAHGGVGRVEWPVTEALEKAGLVDAFRDANPSPVKAPGITWSPVRPQHEGGGVEPQDRIDQVQYAGRLKVLEAHSLFTGWPRPVPDTSANGWPSDHAAAVVTFSLSARG
ncbi:endonuclease/exonuclease/phosphatase family protein [Streptomyces gibsoniae]|uniref:Endonuclease/exonuclease/phosphatase family protein n=1 Tax=Streptomyces gibsoniae TaxID=3075529 RepID=A0ABU2TV50_9ACTN|nr:endonuclease/exonuclease/phosphatase family protein [Streptomyces sp. DSM 41699]MDT0464841.1 endonuclease/exonuclease/phosphatase family protein [Streptomyces sp. DSM 41699]